MWVGGWECKGGGTFVKRREDCGFRQTEWGNTWQKSQINKQDREGGDCRVGDREQGYFLGPDKSLESEIKATRHFLSGIIVCSKLRGTVKTGSGKHFDDNFA